MDTQALIREGRFPDPATWRELKSFLELRGACDMAIVAGRRVWAQYEKTRL